MESYHCARSLWASGDVVTWFQCVSDLLIALSYIAIPLELVYLSRKLSLSPYRVIFLQFEAFIVICGATHLINLWVLSCHTKTVDIVQAIAKVLCAIVTSAATIKLISIIHAFLNYKLKLSPKGKVKKEIQETVGAWMPKDYEVIPLQVMETEEQMLLDWASPAIE